MKASTQENDMDTDNAQDINGLKLTEFQKHFPVVFIDPSGYLNMCSKMSENTYLKVKQEATLAIEFLNNSFIESFDPLFMKKFSFVKQFDALIK